MVSHIIVIFNTEDSKEQAYCIHIDMMEALQYDMQNMKTPGGGSRRIVLMQQSICLF